ncbi:ParB/RepB/Spo0J family partition protein [Candidatus Magnetobacterium casense]|uniref:ParB N-terminal domain-containing protein n=1 Tax=Candidatus Magnetobacterium casense TaxID=1455061 RepID=A0ABS6S448_9BACT|nr:ParB N-terminal domain-containing protein [Candidatus Magnetobacterium casensis]
MTNHRDNRISLIAVGDLQIDHYYQRPLSEEKANIITKNFHIDKVGVLKVSRRDGGYFVIDGQHRLAAAKKRGLTHLPCLIYDDLGPDDEADLRLAFNTRKVDATVDTFRLLLAKQDPTATAIQRIVEDIGLKISLSGGGHPNPRHIRCVGTLMRTYLQYKHGDQLLARVLMVSRRSWPHDSWGRSSHIIQGLTTFLSLYPELSDAALIDKLRRYTPAELLASARIEQATIVGLGREKIIASLILRLYNRGKRNKLPNRIIGR